MKPPAIRQFQISDKQAVYAANFRRATLTEREAIVNAAEEATRLSVHQNISASYLWADVIQGCTETKISLESVLFFDTSASVSLVEQVLNAEDWLSARIIAQALENKSYNNGSIVKSGELFYIANKENGLSFGIKMYSSGALYGGYLKNGNRHGFGVFDSGRNTTYYGDWFEDKKHGQGCSETSSPHYAKQEGIFADGLLVKPKKRKNIFGFLPRKVR